MPLAPGTRLSVYEVVEAVGAGGMGEVYRARDTTLGRDVALKILPESFASQPDRVARFAREAQLLASLNHPHIAHVYGVEQGRAPALVMEFVDGEDLAQRLARGPIPIDEALPIARQIAEALEYAHDQGVVHRDLKPANVKVRGDGSATVLDFGLAKAIEPGAGGDLMNSPTLTARATALGTILGTAAYMAPEQARGRAVDKRADIWAFGAVLYEMLTGRRAFQGEDVTETLTSVMRDTPDWSALPPAVPARLRRLLERCLDRDPRQRLRDIGEARIEIARIESGAPGASPAVAGAAGTPAMTRRRPAIGATVALVLAGSLVTGSAVWWYRPTVASPATVRLAVTLPKDLHIDGTQRSAVAVSPDGRMIAFIASTGTRPPMVYLRSMDAFDAAPLNGTDGAIGPVFSPDAKSLAYWSSFTEAIERVPVAGGAPVKLCSTELPSGMSWSEDGLIFSNTEGIFEVDAEGGTPVQLVASTPSTIMFGPQLLPGGRAVLFTQADANGGTERWDAGRIVVRPVGSGAAKVLVDGGTDARYVSSGHILFARSGLLYAAAFDVEALKLTSKETTVVDGVMRGTGTYGSGTIHLGVSKSGVLAYIPGPLVPSAAAVQIARSDFTGAIEVLPLPEGSYQTPRLSPDGKRLAFVLDDGRQSNVWVYDVGTKGAPRRLTFGGNSRSPVWSRDSSRVVYRSDREGAMALFWQAADGTGTVDRLTPATPGTIDWPTAVSPDGRILLFDRTVAGRTTLWQLSLRDRAVSPVAGIESSQLTGAVFSPDGKWIAYAVRARGDKNALMVQAFPSGGAKYQVSSSTDDAHHPVWSADGDNLFYTPGPGSRLLRLPVMKGQTFAFGTAVAIARPFTNNAGSADRPYDLTPDGQHFIAVQDVTSDPLRREAIDVVLNWFSELRSKVGR